MTDKRKVTNVENISHKTLVITSVLFYTFVFK